MTHDEVRQVLLNEIAHHAEELKSFNSQSAATSLRELAEAFAHVGAAPKSPEVPKRVN